MVPAQIRQHGTKKTYEKDGYIEWRAIRDDLGRVMVPRCHNMASRRRLVMGRTIPLSVEVARLALRMGINDACTE